MLERQIWDNKKNKFVDDFVLNDEEIQNGTKFPTIFVDEAQDYEREWIENIHKLITENGELVFFCDEMQNIYKREQEPVHDKNNKVSYSVVYTGVGGNWNKLEGTYRLGGKIAEFADEFRQYFLNVYENNSLKAQAVQLNFDENTVSYICKEGEIQVNDILEIFDSLIKEYSVHNDDICILADKIMPLREIDYELRKGNILKRKIETITTFASLEDYELVRKENPELMPNQIEGKLYGIQRAAKCNFWMETGKVKLSTVHSYKGWGIHTEILILSENDGTNFLNPEIIYTGITRAIKHLVIINYSNEFYHNFFKQSKVLGHYGDF